jgi:glycerol-3-phosphate dehydrogenase
VTRATHAAPVSAIYDVVIVGGGVNGAGIARDAAGRDLGVLLVEQDDLASHTSSASTKLIHGGLRYLEFYDFGLVRKALQEREVLLALAPHIVWPLRFVMPHDRHLRPAWMIRAGLFLYDHLARRQRLAASRTIDLRTHPAGPPLEAQYRVGFEYADAWVDDSRLVVLNALDAREHGARILTRTRCVAAHRTHDRWHVTLETRTPGSDATSETTITARTLVNATGPWVNRFLEDVAKQPAPRRVRLVKGSHIVVPRLFSHRYAYIFQTTDGRIVFAIPYEGNFTLIGTTDIDYTGDPGAAAIDAAERAYLLEMANRYFARDLHDPDIVWSYSGVRPLLDDDAATNASSVTRDYTLELDVNGAPLLSVYGGKITTFRRLAEEAVDRLAETLGLGARPWTAHAPLPGGDMPQADFDAFRLHFNRRHPWVPERLATRYAHAYGTRAARILGHAQSARDLGDEVLPDFYAAEIEYLRHEEWAMTAEDLLLRRTKLALHVPEGSLERLETWLAAHPPGSDRAA